MSSSNLSLSLQTAFIAGTEHRYVNLYFVECFADNYYYLTLK